MTNFTYHWIQDDGPHRFARRCKALQYRERHFKYFILESYGVQANWGLHVNSPLVLTPSHVLRHKDKIEIRRKFLYEPL